MSENEVRHPVPTPSPTVWGAALAGLLGAVACATATTDHSHDDTDETDPHDTDGILSSEQAPDLTLAEFEADCTARGGIVQIHATCAGNNACRGLSFNKWSKQLTEHTCRGLNSCGGASCVVLQADQGRDPAELFEESCGSMCHGSETFTVYAPPGMSSEDALARLAGRSERTHMAMIAFGVTGLAEGGTPYANMPSFKDKFSRAEIAALVAYVGTLETEVTNYGVPGENEDFTDY